MAGPKPNRLPSMTTAARKRFSTQHRSEISAHVVPPPSESPATPMRVAVDAGRVLPGEELVEHEAHVGGLLRDVGGARRSGPSVAPV